MSDWTGGATWLTVAAVARLDFVEEHPFGVLGCVPVPDVVTEETLALLHPDERDVARSLTGMKQTQWVGGRLAAHAASRRKAARWSVLVGAKGEPVPPPGYAVSIAHKRDVAVALLAKGDGLLGVDVEDDVDAARAIEHMVFDDAERRGWQGLPEPVQDRLRLVAFALKEATYKALAVPSGRELRFADAAVRFDCDVAAVTLQGGGPVLEAWWSLRGGRVIAAVRAERRSRWRTPWSTGR